MAAARHFQAADADDVRSLRHEFMAFLHVICAPTSDFEGAEIAFGELVGNVSRHAPGPVRIFVHADALELVWIEVTDSGPGFVFLPSLPPIDSECGRGLFLISQLCTQVSVTTTGRGTTVRAVLPVALRNQLPVAGAGDVRRAMAEQSGRTTETQLSVEQSRR